MILKFFDEKNIQEIESEEEIKENEEKKWKIDYIYFYINLDEESIINEEKDNFY